MGNNYLNVSVRGLSQQQIVDFLRQMNVSAFVGPQEKAWSCFASILTFERPNGFPPPMPEQVAAQISENLNTVAVYCINSDDDVLELNLFAKGLSIARYNSRPGNFTEDPSEEDLKPRLTNIEAFAELRPNVDLAALREAFLEDYVFAFERHERLYAVLGMPDYSVAFDYDDFKKRRYPFDSDAFVEIRSSPA
jgi:hypothetical protein